MIDPQLMVVYRRTQYTFGCGTLLAMQGKRTLARSDFYGPKDPQAELGCRTLSSVRKQQFVLIRTSSGIVRGRSER